MTMEYGKDYGKPEMMAAAIMREIREGDVVFHGLASPTPMVAMKAAKALGKDFSYVTLTDGVDHDWTSPPGVASTLTANTYEGSVASFGLDEIFDLFCSGKGNIAFLSCLQMDREGRIAMSYLGGDYDHPKLRGPGGAGSATLTAVTPRTIIWKASHDRKTFVEHVDFATAMPSVEKELTLITPLCIFRKAQHQKYLKLSCVFPYTTVEEVVANTGWTIEETQAAVAEPPSEAELNAIRHVDANRILHYEFK
jgi:glutaconate CoA-transferase subunit B